jgi:hypothetical protein
MKLDLYCEHCGHSFTIPADSPAAQVLEQMADLGPWTALGDGETLEDMLCATLVGRECHRCPQCGEAVPVTEESLSQCAHELLLQW